MITNRLKTPRYQTANSTLPGNKTFWDAVLNQSDLFAYNTANDGKGGPFGAQLWLVNTAKDQYVLAGSLEHPEDSNAVVSKGRASAHAEAENLSPEKRQQVVDFLEERRGEEWHLVQVSSGESCPSCRSKQVLFADELIQRGLIDNDAFHVAFKATYDQTRRDAAFNDAPYDQAFRAIGLLGVPNEVDFLFSLEKTLKADPDSAAQIASGELVYNAVNPVEAKDIADNIDFYFRSCDNQPVAVIANSKGEVMGYGHDTRAPTHDGINKVEDTAIIAALYMAAAKLREQGIFEAWNLNGARLYTNIRDIGPMAYAESLWYNLSGIDVVTDYASDHVDDMAQELPGTQNHVSFMEVAADYDSPLSPLRVTFGGNPDEASVAHLLWKARMAMETLKNKQAERLQTLEETQATGFITLDGTRGSLTNLVQSSRASSNYDGKQAAPKPDSP